MPIDEGTSIRPGEHIFIRIDNLVKMERYILFMVVDDVFPLPDGHKVIEGRLITEDLEEPKDDK